MKEHPGRRSQNLAIAYAMKRKGQKKKMADGGEATGADEAQESMRKAFHFADGGSPGQARDTSQDKSLADQASAFFSKDHTQENGANAKAKDPSLDDKYAEIRQKNKENMGYATGGIVYDVTSPQELLHMQEEDNIVPDHLDYYLRPTQYNKQNVAAKHEDAKGLNQHHVDMRASTDMGEEDRVDRIMNKKSQDFSSLARLAHGGPVDASGGDGPYVDDEDSLVNRIMHKKSEPFENLDRYSRGGQVANQEHGENNNELAGFSPNEFDDLVLRDDLESTYGDDDNSGDALGNDQEDEDRKDIVARIMRSQRKKDRLPNPA